VSPGTAGSDREAAGPGRDAAGTPDREAAGPGREAAGTSDREAARPGRGTGGRDREPAARDRDVAGRPRNARPRDQLGRPLARSAAGAPGADEEALPPAAALALAQQLIDAGRPFHAHEVLEARWKAAPAAERDLWQGLAQLAVGLTHARRGNATGAAALLRRGAVKIGASQGQPHDVPAAALSRNAAALADRIDESGLDSIPAAALSLALTTRAAAAAGTTGRRPC
jgi:hypothetical protein